MSNNTPFAIFSVTADGKGHGNTTTFPDNAGTRPLVLDKYPLEITANGAIFEHLISDSKFRTLTNVTFLMLVDAIYAHTSGRALQPSAAGCLLTQIPGDSLVHGADLHRQSVSSRVRR